MILVLNYSKIIVIIFPAVGYQDAGDKKHCQPTLLKFSDSDSWIIGMTVLTGFKKAIKTKVPGSKT